MFKSNPPEPAGSSSDPEDALMLLSCPDDEEHLVSPHPLTTPPQLIDSFTSLIARPGPVHLALAAS